jgi:hypothetical protein
MPLTLVALLGACGLRAADDPKNTIKDVMLKAHDKDSGLLGKVVGGKASKDEKQELAELYADLAKNKPAKGNPQSWKQKTDALVAVSKDVVAGKQGAEARLRAAANCMGCHAAHKGK